MRACSLSVGGNRGYYLDSHFHIFDMLKNFCLEILKHQFINNLSYVILCKNLFYRHLNYGSYQIKRETYCYDTFTFPFGVWLFFINFKYIHCFLNLIYVSWRCWVITFVVLILFTYFINRKMISSICLPLIRELFSDL